MTAINAVTDLTIEDGIAIITVNSPAARSQYRARAGRPR